MLNQAVLEGNDVRSMVSQQQVLDNVFSPLLLANRVSADHLLPVVVENIRLHPPSASQRQRAHSCTSTDPLPSTTIELMLHCTSSWCAFVWSARPRGTPRCTISSSTTSSRHLGSLRACFSKVSPCALE
jgi:hypothetical protein